MIDQSNMSHRNAFTVRFRSTIVPALAAAALLGGAEFAQAAKLDPSITAARARFTTEDIELISSDARATAGTLGTGNVKLNGKNLKSLALFAADAVIAKLPDLNVGPTRPANKSDEIAEGAAGIVFGIAGKTKNTSAGQQKKNISTIFKSALKTAKNTASLVGTTIFRDVAGSVMLTVRNNASYAANIAKLQKQFTKKGVAKGIAGKTNIDAFISGINDGATGVDAATRYEDGNDATLFVADPETDLRNI